MAAAPSKVSALWAQLSRKHLRYPRSESCAAVSPSRTQSYLPDAGSWAHLTSASHGRGNHIDHDTAVLPQRSCDAAGETTPPAKHNRGQNLKEIRGIMPSCSLLREFAAPGHKPWARAPPKQSRTERSGCQFSRLFVLDVSNSK